MVQILIGADLVPTEDNFNLFFDGDISSLVGEELLAVLEKTDYKIFNLECPLIDKGRPIDKCGPNLRAPTATIKGINKITPSFLTLANNHIMDYGYEGLESTINILNDNCIHYAGVGKNINEASKPYIVNIKGHNIGIYCCAEHEFSIATKNRAGANPFDVLYSFEHIKRLKEICETVIVLFHGGKEMYRYPSPMLQKYFRKFAESGADIVIAQHTHCIGAYEEYEGSLLLYGQGNFLFNGYNDEYWNSALLLNIKIDKKSINYSFIPIIRSGCGIRIANGSKAERILAEFYKRSEEIKNEDTVSTKYLEYVSLKRKEYYCAYLGLFGSILYRLDWLFKGRLLKFIYPKKKKYLMYNYLECESHLEVFKKILEKDIGV